MRNHFIGYVMIVFYKDQHIQICRVNTWNVQNNYYLATSFRLLYIFANIKIRWISLKINTMTF